MTLEDLNQDGGECDCEEGAPAWMATFSDMATLLLTFFVLLLSFANLDVENFRMALGSVKQALGVQMEADGSFEGLSSSPADPVIQISDSRSRSKKVRRDRDLATQVAMLQRFIHGRGMGRQIEVEGTPRGIVLRIKELVLYRSGSDELTPESTEVLRLVGEVFDAFEGNLIIEGHTDNRPINSERFPSNWELSTARSTAVLRFFIREKHIDVRRVGIAGYGDSRPVAENGTKTGRAKNRRVDFLFETHPDGEEGETHEMRFDNEKLRR
jgi:chemotaxis protein MotB